MKKFVVLLAVIIAVLILFNGCNRASGNAGGLPVVRVIVYDRGTDGGKTDPTNNRWTDWIKQKVLEDELRQRTIREVVAEI